MADVVDAATRSRMMAGIRSKDTKPEVLVRKALHARGFRYPLNSRGLPGRPDVVLPKWKVAVFVHGCFWHSHGCHLSKLPASNTAFWKTKLDANHERDLLAQLTLISAGWRTVTIWECALRGRAALERLPQIMDQLAAWIRDQAEQPVFEISGDGSTASSGLAFPVQEKT
mgnify:CR=1 FL=1